MNTLQSVLWTSRNNQNNMSDMTPSRHGNFGQPVQHLFPDWNISVATHCHAIWDRFSWSPEDKSWWATCRSKFLSCEIFQYLLDELAQTSWFPCNDSYWLWWLFLQRHWGHHLFFSEMSQQLLKGLSWKSLHTFMFPSGIIVITLLANTFKTNDIPISLSYTLCLETLVTTEHITYMCFTFN